MSIALLGVDELPRGALPTGRFFRQWSGWSWEPASRDCACFRGYSEKIGSTKALRFHPRFCAYTPQSGIRRKRAGPQRVAVITLATPVKTGVSSAFQPRVSSKQSARANYSPLSATARMNGSSAKARRPSCGIGSGGVGHFRVQRPPSGGASSLDESLPRLWRRELRRLRRTHLSG